MSNQLPFGKYTTQFFRLFGLKPTFPISEDQPKQTEEIISGIEKEDDDQFSRPSFHAKKHSEAIPRFSVVNNAFIRKPQVKQNADPMRNTICQLRPTKFADENNTNLNNTNNNTIYNNENNNNENINNNINNQMEIETQNETKQIRASEVLDKIKEVPAVSNIVPRSNDNIIGRDDESNKDKNVTISLEQNENKKLAFSGSLGITQLEEKHEENTQKNETNENKQFAFFNGFGNNTQNFTLNFTPNFGNNTNDTNNTNGGFNFSNFSIGGQQFEVKDQEEKQVSEEEPSESAEVNVEPALREEPEDVPMYLPGFSIEKYDVPKMEEEPKQNEIQKENENKNEQQIERQKETVEKKENNENIFNINFSTFNGLNTNNSINTNLFSFSNTEEKKEEKNDTNSFGLDPSALSKFSVSLPDTAPFGEVEEKPKEETNTFTGFGTTSSNDFVGKFKNIEENKTESTFGSNFTFGNFNTIGSTEEKKEENTLSLGNTSSFNFASFGAPQEKKEETTTGMKFSFDGFNTNTTTEEKKEENKLTFGNTSNFNFASFASGSLTGSFGNMLGSFDQQPVDEEKEIAKLEEESEALKNTNYAVCELKEVKIENHSETLANIENIDVAKFVTKVDDKTKQKSQKWEVIGRGYELNISRKKDEGYTQLMLFIKSSGRPLVINKVEKKYISFTEKKTVNGVSDKNTQGMLSCFIEESNEKETFYVKGYFMLKFKERKDLLKVAEVIDNVLKEEKE